MEVVTSSHHCASTEILRTRVAAPSGRSYVWDSICSVSRKLGFLGDVMTRKSYLAMAAFTVLLAAREVQSRGLFEPAMAVVRDRGGESLFPAMTHTDRDDFKTAMADVEMLASG